MPLVTIPKINFFGIEFEAPTTSMENSPKQEDRQLATARGWVRQLPVFFQEFLFWEIFTGRFFEPHADFFKNLDRIIPYNVTSPKMDSMVIRIHLYNLLILLALFITYFQLRMRTALFPYYRCYKQILRLLEKFTLKTSGSIQRSLPLDFRGWGNNISKNKGWEADLLDPRTLELELISVLSMAQRPAIPLLHGPEHRITLPPERNNFYFR